MKRFIASTAIALGTLISSAAMAQQGAPMVPSCETDAECGSSLICVYNECVDPEGYCQTDADCAGQYEHCVGRSATTIHPVPAPVPMPDEGGDPPAEPTDPAPPMEPMEPPTSWGFCRVDLDLVEVDADCQAMCETVAACAGSFDSPPPSTSTGTSSSSAPANSTEPAPADGGGSAGSEGGSAGAAPMPPRDEGDEDAVPMPPEDEPYDVPVPVDADEVLACAQVCSFSKTMNAGAQEAAALETCVASATCDTMEDACEDAAAAWIEEVDATIDVSSSFDGESGGMANTTMGTLAQTNDPTAPTDPGALSGAADIAGCNAGSGGLPLGSGLIAMFAGLFLVLRRRALVMAA